MFEIIKNIIDGAESIMSEMKFLSTEIKNWIGSEQRLIQLKGDRYYRGDQEILYVKREAIGEDGEKVEIENLPNNHIIDNQYAKLVDQKVNYLLSKPMTFDTENKKFNDILKVILNNRFRRQIKGVGQDSFNGALGWIHPYYDSNGEFKFKRFRPYEILAFWNDDEHTDLHSAIRYYEVDGYEGLNPVTIYKVEYYTLEGIKYFEYKNGELIPDSEKPEAPYFVKGGTGYNWTKIPLIPFKSNGSEIALISRVKSLQDAINSIMSTFMNNMQEDVRNTILVLVNYDGEKLGTFRKNLATYGAVKVKTVDGAAGDLKTLQIEVNAENYKTILQFLKDAIVENGRGLDAKSDKMGSNVNEMNIQSMYSDLDLDANEMELEYQASFEDLFWFIKNHLKNTGQGDFMNIPVDIIFNRDILINETQTITNCVASIGMGLSLETVVSNHPWVTDVDKELARIKKQKQEDQAETDAYKNAFGDNKTGDDGGDDE